MEELKIKELEVQRINLQSNDILMVTINHEDCNEEAIIRLRDQFRAFFPNNKVMFFAMGSEGSVKFTVVSQPDVCYSDKKENKNGQS